MSHAPFFSKARLDHDRTTSFVVAYTWARRPRDFRRAAAPSPNRHASSEMRLPGQDKVIEASVVIGLDELLQPVRGFRPTRFRLRRVRGRTRTRHLGGSEARAPISEGFEVRHAVRTPLL